jgi:hypothetical protein
MNQSKLKTLEKEKLINCFSSNKYVYQEVFENTAAIIIF